jgi:hypothetical protein
VCIEQNAKKSLIFFHFFFKFYFKFYDFSLAIKVNESLPNQILTISFSNTSCEKHFSSGKEAQREQKAEIEVETFYHPQKND